MRMREYKILVPEDAMLSYIHPSLACAIGALTTNWTLAEGLSEIILANCLGMDDEFGWLVTTKLGNVTRMEIMENIAHYVTRNRKLADHVLHGVALFNRNRENRNTVIHALVDVTPSLDDGSLSEQVTFIKRDLHKGVRRRVHKTTVDKVWGTAADIKALTGYLSILDDCFIATWRKKRVPWPGKVPLPDRLDLRLSDH